MKGVFHKTMRDNYRPQRSCGQGYVFTRVCDSVHGGGLWADPPRPGRENPPPGTRQTPPRPCRENPPWDQADPPGNKTAAYGQWAAGTHPTGMHSCLKVIFTAYFVLQSIHNSSDMFQTLCITPESLAFDVLGSVCFLDLATGEIDFYIFFTIICFRRKTNENVLNFSKAEMHCM